MPVDGFSLFLFAWVFFIYGAIFIIALIFTFSLEAYERIDSKLKEELFPKPLVSFLDRNINWLDEFLIAHNQIVGPCLLLLSLFDLKFTVDAIVKL